MIIHVVQKGETIDTIAQKYGVSKSRLMLENNIENPNRLVVGEAIVVLYPEVVYTIQEGDTLFDIADNFKVSVMQLLRNNPYLSDRKNIYPGETIVISYQGEKIRKITINAYAYPFIDINILKKTLPFLTYLTVYSYEASADGEVDDIDDTGIIELAKGYGVAPLMMISATSKSLEEEINVVHSILSSKEKQERLYRNIVNILQTKGYIGVNFNTPYIAPGDRKAYEDFIVEFAERLSEQGYEIYNTFSVRIFQILTGTIYSGIDYARIGQAVDGILLVNYIFGYSEGIPSGSTSMESLERFIEYTTRVVDSEKLNVGVPVIGYLWRYSYIPTLSKGLAVSYETAIETAYQNDAEIFYDETTSTAYFQFITDYEYIVRFWDARSIDSFVKLVPEFDLNGISIWNIMSWFAQSWLVINSQYEIDKII